MNNKALSDKTTKYSLTNKESMIALGGRIYDCVAIGLRRRGGALETACEILRGLTYLSSLLSKHLRLYKLDVLDCEGPDVPTVVALHTLKRHITSLTILHMSHLQLSCLSGEDAEEIIAELWILMALTSEAIKTTEEFIKM